MTLNCCSPKTYLTMSSKEFDEEVGLDPEQLLMEGSPRVDCERLEADER